MPLFEAMGYESIRYTHGPLEYGKDFVFNKPDELSTIHCAAVVKSGRLSGSVSKHGSIHEVYHQVSQALIEPYIDPFRGESVNIERVYVITPFPISSQAIASIRGHLQQLHSRVIFIDGPYLHSLLKKHVPALLISLPDPTSRYLDILLRRLKGTTNSLSRAGGSDRDRSVVPAQLSQISSSQAQFISFSRPEFAERTLRPDDLLVEKQYSVIVADVGAGKTTLLHSLAILLSSDSDAVRVRRLPLLVSLHELPADSFQSQEALELEIGKYIEKKYTRPTHQASDAVLMLDGFDELPAKHKELEMLLDPLTEKYARILLTTRPTRVPTRLERFRFFRLEPLRDEDIAEFVSMRFSDRSEIAGSLLRRIRADPMLNLFCRTPLMLTLYCFLAERIPIKRIPVRRTDIYGAIVERLLGDWDEERGIKSEHRRVEKEIVLERVALRCHIDRRRHFSIRELQEAYSDTATSLPSRDDQDSLCREIVYRSSLISAVDSAVFSFTHLSFQEFFAARALARTSDGRLLRESIFDEWFRGIWVFYFGIKQTLEEASQLKAKRLSGNGLRLLEYLAEAEFTPVKLRRRLVQATMRDLLDRENLTDAEVLACGQAGDELFPSLVETFERARGKRSTKNIFRIACYLKRPSLRNYLYRSEKVLNDSTADDIVTVFLHAESWLDSAEAEAFFENALIVLPKKWSGSQLEDKCLANRKQLSDYERELTARIELTAGNRDGVVKARNFVRRALRELVVSRASWGRKYRS